MMQSEDFDTYMAQFPEKVSLRLGKIRKAVRRAAPEAFEKMSYGMPAYTLNGMLLYYAAYKYHIGLYPMASGVAAFTEELQGYKTAKGSIQFPHNKPLPMRLINEIIKFRVAENREKGR